LNLKTERTVRAFEGQWIDDGYDFFGVGHNNGWKTVYRWGADGWDIGEWPYVVYLTRKLTWPGMSGYQLASYHEGDIEIRTFDTSEEREAVLDEAALCYWKHDPQSCGLENEIAAIQAGGPIPEKLKGPYRRAA